MNLRVLDDTDWTQQVDPLADKALLAVLAEGGPKAVDVALELLSNQPPHESWSPALRDFAQHVHQQTIADLDEARLETAQRAFMTFGLLNVAILGCASLPETYCLPGTARLLAMSGQLTRHAGRRFVMTAQMVFDVMTPGSLKPGGVAVRAVARTRLMHAALRHMVWEELQVAQDTHDLELRREVLAWTAEFGQPVNQLELVYTLMTFSHVVLRSVVLMGLDPQKEAFEDYIYTWNIVGRMLGIEPALLPDSMADAERLFEAIKTKHAKSTPQGAKLIAALEEYWRQSWPSLLRPAALPVMHALFDQLLTPETRVILRIKTPQTLAQRAARLSIKVVAVGLRLAEHLFMRFPAIARLAARAIRRFVNKRTATSDGGLYDTQQHVFHAWSERVKARRSGASRASAP